MMILFASIVHEYRVSTGLGISLSLSPLLFYLFSICLLYCNTSPVILILLTCIYSWKFLIFRFAHVFLSLGLTACVGFCRRGKSCWEHKYLRLEESELQIFDHEPTSETMVPSQKFMVCRPEGTTSILSSVPYSDVVNTAKSDLPFIFKVCIVVHT